MQVTGYSDLFHCIRAEIAEVAKNKVAIYVLTEVCRGAEVAIPRLAAKPLVVKHNVEVFVMQLKKAIKKTKRTKRQGRN